MNKLCECGCGLPVKNESNRFLRGHMFKLRNNDPQYKEKIKAAILAKYGVDNISKCFNIKQKKKDSCILHYGVENPSQSEEIQKKCKETCLKNHGVEYSLQSKEVQEKSKKSMLKNHGVEFAQQSKEVQRKSKYTVLEKYGVEHISQSKEIREKSKQTCLEHFGVDNPSKCSELQNKKIHTNLLRFGVDNYSKTFNFRLAARNRLIERIKRNYGSINPRVGNNELEFFDELKKYVSYKLILNEYFYGYYPDARIEELKLIIEFDEPEHFIRNWYKERDIQKNKDYEYLGYRVIRIKESDWLKNREVIINNFKQIAGGKNEFL